MPDEKKSDTNILIEDGKVLLPFGGQAVEVRALTIEKSVAWTQGVKVACFKQAMTLLDIQKGGKDKSPDERIAGLLAAIESGACNDLLVVRDFLVDYGIPPETVNKGTAQEIVSAFETCYAAENPMERLRLTVTKMLG